MLPGIVDAGIVVPSGEIEELCKWAIRGCVPVGASLNAGHDEGAFGAGCHAGNLHGAATFVEAGGPGLFDEGFAEEVFAGSAIKDVEEAVAIAPEHGLAGAAFPFEVGEDGDLGGVEIEAVVGRELEVPFELAGVRIEGNDAVGVEVVAGAHTGVPVWAGVAGAPVGEVEFGVVGAGEPDGAAAVDPGVAAPSFVAGLAFFGDGFEAPDFAASGCVVGSDEATDAELAAGGADDDFVFDY